MLEIDKREADIVKLIFSLYLEGKSTRDIFDYLNKKGYKTRNGKSFYNGFINKLLQNRIYTGKVVWNKKHYDKNQKTKKYYKYIKNDPSKVIIAQGRHTPIISEQDFEKVQKLLAEKKRTWRPRVKKSEYLLSEVLVCAKCNHKYFGSLAISNHRTNKKKRWYRCSGPQVGRIKCTNRSIKAEDIEPEITKIIAQLVQNDRLKQYRCIPVTLPKTANFPNLGKSAQIDTTLLRNKLEENHQKQSKLTDAYLENLLGEDVFRGKIEGLRKEEDELKILLAGYELREIESERSEGYLNRVKDFLEGYDDSLTKVSFGQKRQMVGLLFKNIKIAPAIGGALPPKRIAFSLFPPFNFLFSETERKSQCQKNQIVTKIRRKKSTSKLSAAR